MFHRDGTIWHATTAMPENQGKKKRYDAFKEHQKRAYVKKRIEKFHLLIDRESRECLVIHKCHLNRIVPGLDPFHRQIPTRFHHRLVKPETGANPHDATAVRHNTASKHTSEHPRTSRLLTCISPEAIPAG
jgi:hypothetical protein